MVTIVMAHTNLRCIFLQKRLFVNRAVLCCRKQKIDEDSNFLYRETAFLELFMAFAASVDAGEEDDEPEALD